VIQRKAIAVTLGIAVACGYGGNLLTHREDTSIVRKVTGKPHREGPGGGGKEHEAAHPDQESPFVHGIAESAGDAIVRADHPEQTDGSGRGARPRGEPMKYKAPQIIERPGGDPDRKLPIGSSFIGRLISGIDTREANQMVRVSLPYGGSFDHDRKIEKGSMIFGRASYPGDGEKAYIQFNRLLFPDGHEFKIQAEALSPRDYTPGLAGNEHDGAGDRIFATTGLTMLSGITDALTEKEEMGVLGATTPKANLHNALMNGFAKSTESEAEREGDQIKNSKDFVTIPAGTDIIVSLTETFHGEEQ
jgi:hypothetical protein